MRIEHGVKNGEEKFTEVISVQAKDLRTIYLRANFWHFP